MTNVGSRPTFESDGRVLAEAHLIDFEGDLYGRRLELSFLHHLRRSGASAGSKRLRKQIACRCRGGAPTIGGALSSPDTSEQRLPGGPAAGVIPASGWASR